MITVIEKQNKDVSRTYRLAGPTLETVTDFWDYLVRLGIVESYEVEVTD